jgi:hypothetical protein
MTAVPAPTTGGNADRVGRSATPAARVHTAVTVGLLVLTVLVLVCTAADLHVPGRLLLTVAVALTAPGWAVACRLRLGSAAMEWTVAVAVSMAAGLLVSLALLLTGGWAPVPAMVGLLALTVLGLLDALRVRRRREVTG